MTTLAEPHAEARTRFDLVAELSALHREPALRDRGRTARTLVNEGALHVSLIALRPGAAMAKHRAAGRVLAQVLEGEVVFTVDGLEHVLRPGDLLSLEPGDAHAVTSRRGGAFLLTLVMPAS